VWISFFWGKPVGLIVSPGFTGIHNNNYYLLYIYYLLLFEMQNRLLKTLTGNSVDRPALWMMRQAGRYLPEYLMVRQKAGSFWNLCFNPDLATEVTLQPIRRFDYDAAIIFSDILVIPQAMGQKVEFQANHGPVLDELKWDSMCQFQDWTHFDQGLTPVYQAIRQTRNKLDSGKDLLGFAGTPWTIATYMLDQGKGNDHSKSRLALQNPSELKPLINILTTAIARHLISQIKAGADAVQLFDSWASIVPEQHRDSLLFDPLEKIVKQINSEIGRPIPIIYFGRGITDSYPKLCHRKLPVALGVDQAANLAQLHEILPKDIVLQGNLNPETLIKGGDCLDQEIYQILDVCRNRPMIFNLGHGILPQTPIPNVERVCELVRAA
jgi:uroporphyrinogen decarboxylase